MDKRLRLSAAQLLVPALKALPRCLTRDNVMRQATSLKNVKLAVGLSRSRALARCYRALFLPVVL